MAKDKSKKSKAEEPEVKKSKKSKAPEPEVKKGKKSKPAEEAAPTKAKKSKAADDDELVDPAEGGDSWNFTEEAAGELVVVTALKEPETVTTKAYGDKEAIRCRVVVVDEKKPAKSEVHNDVLIFPSVLIGSLRKTIGQAAVGRLEQGEAKKGQNAPWILTKADADERETAKAALKAIRERS